MATASDKDDEYFRSYTDLEVSNFLGYFIKRAHLFVSVV